MGAQAGVKYDRREFIKDREYSSSAIEHEAQPAPFEGG